MKIVMRLAQAEDASGFERQVGTTVPVNMTEVGVETRASAKVERVFVEDGWVCALMDVEGLDHIFGDRGSLGVIAGDPQWDASGLEGGDM